MEREINFYRTVTQKCLVKEFLDALPAKVSKKVTWVLALLEELAVIPAHYFTKMPGIEDIWECRVKSGSNIYRIFAFWDENKIIFTHGFIKKTPRTPKREIEKAENYKRDYWNRKVR